MKVKRILKSKVFDFYTVDLSTKLEIPISSSTVSAGFPSPAEDYIELKLDLNKKLIKNPSTTFLVVVKGNSMIDAGIKDGDILVIDKSIEPKNGAIAVCFIDKEFTVKRIKIEKKVCYLMPANSEFNTIMVTQDNELIIWGIVTWGLHKYIK